MFSNNVRWQSEHFLFLTSQQGDLTPDNGSTCCPVTAMFTKNICWQCSSVTFPGNVNIFSSSALLHSSNPESNPEVKCLLLNCCFEFFVTVLDHIQQKFVIVKVWLWNLVEVSWWKLPELWWWGQMTGQEDPIQCQRCIIMLQQWKWRRSMWFESIFLSWCNNDNENEKCGLKRRPGGGGSRIGSIPLWTANYITTHYLTIAPTM